MVSGPGEKMWFKIQKIENKPSFAVVVLPVRAGALRRGSVAAGGVRGGEERVPRPGPDSVRFSRVSQPL